MLTLQAQSLMTFITRSLLVLMTGFALLWKDTFLFNLIDCNFIHRCNKDIFRTRTPIDLGHVDTESSINGDIHNAFSDNLLAEMTGFSLIWKNTFLFNLITTLSIAATKRSLYADSDRFKTCWHHSSLLNKLCGILFNYSIFFFFLYSINFVFVSRPHQVLITTLAIAAAKISSVRGLRLVNPNLTSLFFKITYFRDNFSNF